MWSGDERGGKVKRVWVAEEDWIDDDGDCTARSEVQKCSPDDYDANAKVWIPKGTPHLMVD